MKTSPGHGHFGYAVMRRRLALLVALASLVGVMVGEQRQAAAGKGYPTVGVEFRSGDTFAFQAGAIGVFGASPYLPRPIIPSLRAELAVGGAGAGLGLVIPATDKPDPDLRDLLFGGFILVEMRVERMYGGTSWNHSIYAGPQVTLYPSVAPKISVGCMADTHRMTERQIQLGIGFGF